MMAHSSTIFHRQQFHLLALCCWLVLVGHHADGADDLSSFRVPAGDNLDRVLDRFWHSDDDNDYGDGEDEYDEYDEDDISRFYEFEDGFEPFLGYDEGHEFTPAYVATDASIEDYLNDKYRDPTVQVQIGRALRAGKLVVLRDAFQSDIAQRMHEELWMGDFFQLHEEYNEDGFTYHHHNGYDDRIVSPFVKDVQALFKSEATKRFMQELSGRDTLAEPEAIGSPSWYMPWDYSAPHADYADDRTVAYVWHLSKNWRTEWGGALYWCPVGDKHAIVPASWNTLVLFSVSGRTTHFVTPVSQHSQGKRLTFNGWWDSENWIPSLAEVDDEFVGYISHKKHRDNLTARQVETFAELRNEIEVASQQGPLSRTIRELAVVLSLFEKEIMEYQDDASVEFHAFGPNFSDIGTEEL